MRRLLPLFVLSSVPALFSVAHAQAPLPVLPGASASASSGAPPASATAPPAASATAAPVIAGQTDPAEWQARYDAAGRKMMGGDFLAAIQEYSALAATAPNENARNLALEQLRVATEFAHRQQGGPAATGTAPALAVTGPTSALDLPPDELPPPTKRVRDPYARTTDELAFLYVATPLYGFTTGFWLDALITGTDGWSSKATAGAFFSGLGATGLAALTVAMLDSGKKFKYGGAQSITTGLSIGFGEGLAMALWAGNRTESSFSTYRKFTSYVWGFSTAGIVGGSLVAAYVPTTPGRSSWVGSTALAGGLFVGGLAGAFTPNATGNNDDNVRSFGLTAAIGGLAGIGVGIFTAPLLSPSIARVRFIDLAWVSGAVLSLGFCEAYGNSGHGCTERTAFGAMAAGAGVGFIVGALATMGLKGDPLEDHIPGAVPKEASFLDKLTPTVMPTQGGVNIGVAGQL